MSDNTFRAGIFQFAPKFGDIQTNLASVCTVLKGARADLIVLPELAFTGYAFQDRNELASLAEEPTDSTTVKTLTHLCQENSFHLVTGFAEKSGDKLFNSAFHIGPDGVLDIYRKLHLFNREKTYFDPGDKPLQTFDLNGVKIGMMVCYDWAFPEVARVLALQGADLICHPSNLVLSHGQQAMRIRSLENGLYTFTCNRFGSDVRSNGSTEFTGKSQIVGPKGTILFQASPDQPELFIAELNITLARDKKLTPNDDLLSDRRPEFYPNIG